MFVNDANLSFQSLMRKVTQLCFDETVISIKSVNALTDVFWSLYGNPLGNFSLFAKQVKSHKAHDDTVL